MMFVLVELDTRRRAELMIRAIGDSGHCGDVMRQLTQDGRSAGNYQSHYVHGGLWDDQDHRFSIAILAIGTTAYCNNQADMLLVGQSECVRDSVIPGDTGTRILTQVIDIRRRGDKVYPDEFYIGRLQMNREAWRGAIPGTTFSDHVRDESETRKQETSDER